MSAPSAINEKILVGYVILSSTSGVLYLVFLVFFALADNFVTRDAPAAGPIVLGGDTARQRKEKHDAHVRQATVWGFALIGRATDAIVLLRCESDIGVRPLARPAGTRGTRSSPWLKPLSETEDDAMDIKIFVEGHVDDLYALSLLFPEGAYPGLHVVTGLKGEKHRPFDRVTDASDRKTYVTGEGCLPLLATRRHDEAGWVAREILAPLRVRTH